MESKISKKNNSMSMNQSWLCPVCGYSLGFSAWNEGSASEEICPSCGIQFGYDDFAGGDVVARQALYRSWRDKWVSGGMKWNSMGIEKPKDWNPIDQLKQVR